MGLFILAAAGSLVGGVGCGMRETLPPVVPLPVNAPPPTDDQLTAAIHARLDHDWIFQARDIRVASSGGVVMLTGWVETYAERSLALDIVKTTPGVQSIDNDIRVIRN